MSSRGFTVPTFSLHLLHLWHVSLHLSKTSGIQQSGQKTRRITTTAKPVMALGYVRVLVCVCCPQWGHWSKIVGRRVRPLRRAVLFEAPIKLCGSDDPIPIVCICGSVTSFRPNWGRNFFCGGGSAIRGGGSAYCGASDLDDSSTTQASVTSGGGVSTSACLVESLLGGA